MNDNTQAAIRDAAEGSAEGRLHFDQVVDQLMRAGVESYLADYRARRTIFYLPDGETLDIALHMPDIAIADHFDAPAIQAAIHGSQQGLVKYPEFKRLCCVAGCIGYAVWIAGRHVTYFGRRGETHVEPFPR